MRTTVESRCGMAEHGRRPRRLWRIGIAAASVAILASAIVWPWPAPIVDWQQPLERAIADRECSTVNAILVEVSTARATEVYDYYARLADSGTCRERDAAEARSFREMKRADDWLAKRRDYDWRPRDKDDALLSVGLVYDAKLSLLNFVCIAPYNAFLQPDYARLAQGLRTQRVHANLGFWHDLHVERRAVCADLIGRFIEDLLNTGTDEAGAVAHDLLWLHIGRDIPGAGSMFAELVLGRGFKPSGADGAVRSRRRAWHWIEGDAAEGHLPAIKLMMNYLHEGRFRGVDNKGAYFWGLRLKRLGGEPGETLDEISAKLTSAERAHVEESERTHSFWTAAHT